MKILIVDDEPIVRLALKRAMTRRGHQVHEAEDGKQALEMWPNLKPDLVFLDVLMPKMSGPDLLKALPALERSSAKIVLMSAFTGEYDLERAKSLGADLFVQKPFDDVFLTAQQAEGLLVP